MDENYIRNQQISVMRETEYYSPPLAADYQHSEVMCINNVMWINRSLAHNTLQIRALYVLTRRTNYAGSPLSLTKSCLKKT